MIKSAKLSDDRAYRYTLHRTWVGREGVKHRFAMFIGLNPSTADETVDDATIRRCMVFARDWGYDGLLMTNLFAFRARHPAIMKGAKDPVGEDNDMYLSEWAHAAGVIVAAWGPPGTFMNRSNLVYQMMPKLHYLKLTKDGHPSHPLYLSKDLKPMRWKE